MYWQWDHLGTLPAVLREANWAWVGAAVVCQAASVSALARLQRRLLAVDGGRPDYPAVLATTYAGNAISASLPIVGTAASAVFSYQRFQRIGAEKAVAAWSLAVAGLFSTVALFSLSAVGALMSGSVGVAAAGLVTMLGGVLPILLAIFGLGHPAIRRTVTGLLAALLRTGRRLTRRPVEGVALAAGLAVERIAHFRLSRNDLSRASRFALSNRLADIGCLLCALYAVGAPIPWHGFLLAWAAGAGTSTLGLTPGGLGVVEAALSMALVAAGVPTALAVSAVLIYRFVKLWLVLGAGAITLIVIRSRARGDLRPA